MKKIKQYLDKIFNKPIELNQYEATWIKYCKNHYQNKLVDADLLDQMKIIFKDIYGWDPNDKGNEQDYLICLCNALLDIFLKIQNDQSGNNNQLKSVLSSSFKKGQGLYRETPIERVVEYLVGQISVTNYLNKYGNPRYRLDKDIY